MSFKNTPISKRTWIESAGGYLVPEVKCPLCGARVVYNGNYFCEYWGHTRDDKVRVGGPCNWALAHPACKKADREICDTLGLDYG